MVLTQCYIVISLLITSVCALSNSEIESSKKVLSFSWFNDNNTFVAGDEAEIKIEVTGNPDNNGSNLPFDKHALNLTLTVNGKVGNSSYISGVSSNLEGDFINWTLYFTPIVTGMFNVVIADDHLGLSDSSLRFQVVPGRVYPSACVASWMGLVNEFEAGTRVTILILPMDAFGNNISSTAEESVFYSFNVSALYANGSEARILNVSHTGWNVLGYFSIEFIAATAGDLLLYVEGGNQSLSGSPLSFKVNPGLLDVSSCEAEWNFGTNTLQIFSKMEIFIHQKDSFGNRVHGWYEFDAQIVEEGTHLSIPVADLHFEEVVPGVQLFSSTVLEEGKFLLNIYSVEHKQNISKMPYDFTVFVGYCDGFTSIINGSGLDNSVAGEVAKFSVFLNDVYQYPSAILSERLRVQILRQTDSNPIWPSIYPIQTFNGSRAVVNLSNNTIGYGGIVPIGSAPRPSTNLNDAASAFQIVFTPDKSGLYEILVCCGNIPLNAGHKFTKDVKPADVNVSLSGVAEYAIKVPKLVKNEITVRLMDSFFNPILRQESKMLLEIVSNSSVLQTWMFVDNNDGSYLGHYMIKDSGSYELCVSCDGKHFPPCPFEVNVYSSEYFPKANGDTISIWEDESIAFDALANDYFAGGNASIHDFSRPAHGSLLQYKRLFRYTPFKGFFGNDSITYTITDVNGNLATGTVSICVLCIPPQFVYNPNQLQAIEDVISPRSGGFTGLMLRYSDLVENISVSLNAQYGTLLLSPLLMQFGQPTWGELSISTGDGDADDLTFKGTVEVINVALQSIQYLGNGNFCGNDIIRISTTNRNGINKLKVPLLVEPINDPPFINVDEFVILKEVDGEISKVFSGDNDKLEFRIGDPDFPHFLGCKSQFEVIFSMEVSSGLLSTILPAELINTTELKLKTSYQWQPLQTFVSISKHFTIKAKGVRFRGTIDDCNSVMQQLSFQGGDRGAVLTLNINDMGNYGCYEDCFDKLSVPLFAEATINLVRRRPMSSLEAHALGSAVVIEFVFVFTFGMILLFFSFKCAIVLLKERREQKATKPSTISTTESPQENRIASLSDDATYLSAHCSSSSLPGSQKSNFRQRKFRSRRQLETGESSKPASAAHQAAADYVQGNAKTISMPLEIETRQAEKA